MRRVWLGRRQWIATALASLIAVGVLAGCGTDNATNGSHGTAGTTTRSAPTGTALAGAMASTALAQPVRSCMPDPSVFPVEIDDPWPSSDPVFPDEALAISNSEAASRYGSAHPDEFSGTVVLHNPQRLAVAFTGSLDKHRAALASLVPHPEQLLVVHGCMSEAESGRLVMEIIAIASRAGVLRNAGGDAIAGFISIVLRADGQDVAHELVQRFGEKVVITVGLQPYPLGSTLPDGWSKRSSASADSCSSSNDGLQLQVDPQPGLDVTIMPETSIIRAGADVSAAVRLTNSGTAPLKLEGGNPEVGFIVERGTENIVGVYSGDIAGTGWRATIEPGQSIDGLRALIGTAACRDSDGYAVPPGDYGLVVPLTLGYVRPPAGGGVTAKRVQWSTEVPVTIVAP